MKCEIINVGTELLMGDTINTNASYLSKELVNLGIYNLYHTVVGDNPARFLEVLDIAVKRSEFIILSGGLGPTKDDLTKEQVAQYFNRELVLDAHSEAAIRAFFSHSDKKMSANNLKQALIPEGSIALKNTQGTAPGIYLEVENTRILLLPGPPRELKTMFENEVLPLLQNMSTEVLVSENLYIFGMGESEVASRLNDLLEYSSNPTVAPYAKDYSMHLRISASAQTRTDAIALIQPVKQQIQDALGDVIYSSTDETLEATLVSLLRQYKLRIGAAESCTGGLFTKRLVDIPGSSDILDFSCVTYSNAMKSEILGIDPQLIESEGAVSEQVAIAMAQHIQKIAKSDIGVGITGLAGPGGATDSKPVGLVYIAIQFQDTLITQKLNLARGIDNDRLRIRELACNHAMMACIKHIKSTFE